MKAEASEYLPVAFWLVPAPPFHCSLAATIESLARELKAPSFEPHVTVYVGVRHPDDDMETLLTQAAHDVGTMDLRVTALGTSHELFKALYLEMELDPELERLSRLFRAGLKSASDYVLKPHLSLLYKQLPPPRRGDLARRFDVVGQRITFGQVAAVRPGGGGKDWLDIERWDPWLRKDLMNCPAGQGQGPR
jgi:Cyclic phosphodiesterase-like protein